MKVKKKKLSQLDSMRYMTNLIPALDYTDFSKADMVIEAVFEDTDIMHRVIRECEKHLLEDTIFASNTSALQPARGTTLAGYLGHTVPPVHPDPVH